MARVLVLHGMWMNAASMGVLARRLENAGHDVQRMGYNTVLRTHAETQARIASILTEDPGTHVVAHSLGGMLALDAIERAGVQHTGSVVCMGSPLAGSAAAAALARRGRLAERALARHFDLLSGGVASSVTRTRVGVIAGNRPLGLGGLIHRFEGRHDGSVAVAETQVPGLAGHREIACGHIGLIYSREAADLAIRFLAKGRFD